jgi:MFS family permease
MTSTISQPKKIILLLIVVAQFFCTSLWFAGNAIISNLVKELRFPSSYLPHLTSAVQFGFILGTLVFALLSISDRFSPSKIFCICAVIAALTNLCVNLNNLNVVHLLMIRLITGFFLAGIYPVGMKIVADHFQEGLGKSLGFLVGALVFGTAFPHLLKSINGIPWHYIVFCTSSLSLIGGLIVFIFVPDGTYRKTGQKLSLKAFVKGFSDKKFRSFAFGYFGHMWEQYAFWLAVPIILQAYNNQHSNQAFNIPLFSFLIIAGGGLACVIGGMISKRFGVKKIATISLGLSGACCLASPLFLFNSSAMVFIAFMFVWGMVVIADSPLFSTLVAQHAVAEYKGSSLTIVNCFGFSITIISIQLIGVLKTETNEQYIYMLLALGPILGLIALRKKD